MYTVICQPTSINESITATAYPDLATAKAAVLQDITDLDSDLRHITLVTPTEVHTWYSHRRHLLYEFDIITEAQVPPQEDNQ